MGFSRSGRLLALFKPLGNSRGGIPFLVVVALGVLGVVKGLYDAGAFDPDKLFSYGQYARDAAEGNTDANRNGLQESLQVVKDGLSPAIPLNPAAADDWLVKITMDQIIEGAQIGIDKGIPDSQEMGQPGQALACGISVTPRAAPGEFVTVRVIVPALLNRGGNPRVTSVTGSAAGSGFSVPPSGGEYSYSIPSTWCAPSLNVSYEAWGPEGLVCTRAAATSVDFSAQTDTDGDGRTDPCDDDDDNDSILDGADCAPTDPGRYPGNTEICGDGVDQDCEGNDEPCGPLPCIPANGCCAENPQVCGSNCIPAGAACCNGGPGWCDPGMKCCSGGCIPQTNICCGTTACFPGDTCVLACNACLPAGTVDCGNCKYCPAGTVCGAQGGCFAP